jgi:hypothetical protein
MTRPKGKTPSLLSMSTGIPVVHTCGKATPCDRCGKTLSKGQSCFQIPKMKSGFTSRPIFCSACTADIIEQTKTELSAIEEDCRQLLKA